MSQVLKLKKASLVAFLNKDIFYVGFTKFKHFIHTTKLYIAHILFFQALCLSLIIDFW